MSTAAILDEFSRLQLPEQIQLLEDLWDRIADNTEAVPLTDAQRAELQRRKSGISSWPPEGSSWEEVKSRLMDSDV